MSNEPITYKFDVFLSWTGADRELKNDLKKYLLQRAAEDNPDSPVIKEIYDSDENCVSGYFRKDYLEALSQSKTYLMILSDDVTNNPNLSGNGVFSEVSKEGNFAAHLAAHGTLNMVVVDLTNWINDLHPAQFIKLDEVKKHFYSLTLGLTKKDAKKDENDLLAPNKKEEVYQALAHLIQKRNEGNPVPYYKPFGINVDWSLTGKANESFYGRDTELDSIKKSFLAENTKIAVLYGMGGIGKTTLATEFARQCNQGEEIFCPRIIHIRDLDNGSADQIALSASPDETNDEGTPSPRRRPINPWVDNCEIYDSSLWTQVRDLTSKERKTTLFEFLKELGENFLLVLDNFNDLTESDLLELNTLKCKVLITTRINAKKLEGTNIKPIPVGALPAEVAHRLFLEKAKLDEEEVPLERFKPLYEHVGGHTITLCIIAKTMATHNKVASKANRLTIEKIIDDILRVRTETKYWHNYDETTRTILGHLENLFEFTKLSDYAKWVLKNCSLLDNGTIPSSVLESDNFKSDQSKSLETVVTELCDLGWIETETRAEDDETIIKLHPIISELVSGILKPTSEETGCILSYLLSEQKTLGSAFSDVAKAQDRYFFALFRLAKSEGKINPELWDAFVKNNHLMGNLQDTDDKISRLLPYLEGNQPDRKKAASYRDMLTLELRPTEMDLLKKCVEDLHDNPEDYKAVLKVLSVTASLFLASPAYQKPLTAILQIALKKAMEAKDDLSVIELFHYLMSFK